MDNHFYFVVVGDRRYLGYALFHKEMQVFSNPTKNVHSFPQFPHMEHVEGAPWRGYGNAEARVEWNGMDMDPHYGSICGFRGMDLNPGLGWEDWSKFRVISKDVLVG